MTARRRNLLLALFATSATAVAAPSFAGAETICVHAPAGTACDGEAANLTTALQAAQGTLEPTTIALGASQTGPFVYPDGPIPAGNSVTIKGVGATRPALTGPAGSTILTSSEVSLDGVDVLAGLAPGIGINAAFGDLHDVHVKGGAIGIRAHDGMTLDGVSVAGAQTGVQVQDGETVALTRSRISASDDGLVTRGTLTATATLIETTAVGARGLVGGDGVVALDHVTAVHRGPLNGHEIGLSFHPVDNGGRVDLSSVVVAGYAHEIERDPSEGPSNLPMTIRDSVWDDAHDIFVDEPNTGGVVQSGNVHADPRLVDLAGGDYRLRGSSAAVDRDSQTDPRYVDIDGLEPVGGGADAGAFEYRRRAPVIDTADVPGAGADGQALAFAATASDPDGDAVQLAWDFGDGAVAAGTQATHAFAPGIHTVTLNVTDEAGVSTSRSFTVAIAAGAGPRTGPLTDTIAPKLSKVRLSKNHRRLVFTISERATVRVTVHGRTIVRTVAAGRRSIRLGHLRRGVLKITATDAAGNRSAARRVRS